MPLIFSTQPKHFAIRNEMTIKQSLNLPPILTFLHVSKALLQLVIYLWTKGKVVHKNNTGGQKIKRREQSLAELRGPFVQDVLQRSPARSNDYSSDYPRHDTWYFSSTPSNCKFTDIKIYTTTKNTTTINKPCVLIKHLNGHIEYVLTL